MAYENTLTLLKESKIANNKKSEFLKAILEDSEKVNISTDDAKLLKEVSQSLNFEEGPEEMESTQKKIPTIAEMAEKARLIK